MTGLAAAQTFPSYEVTVDVAIAAGKASVRETYLLASVPAPLDLQYLANQCALLRTYEAELDGRSLTFEESVRGPWVMLHPIPQQFDVERAVTLIVRYDVDLGDVETSVPIIMPSAPLERVEATRGANVLVSVKFDGAGEGGTVLFPRFERLSEGISRAELLAMPSALRVRIPSIADTAQCEPEVPGTSGGLEWRFWVFAGLMALCVPVYLWVFGRQKETGR